MPSTAQPAETEGVEVEVGNYTIRSFHEGQIWIAKFNGEGMSVGIDEFEKILDNYWEKYF